MESENQHPEPVAALPVQAVRFCKTCGAPWLPEWLECPTCSGRRGREAVVGEAKLEFARDTSRVRSAMALYFTLLGVSILSMIWVVIADRPNADLDVVVMMVAGGVDAVITVIWCIALRKTVLPFLIRVAPPKWLGLAAVLAVPTFILAHSVVSFLHHALGVPELTYLEPFLDKGYGFAGAVLVICAQPAIFEEIGFRGIILTSLEPVIGGGEALLVSALMFAILHLSVPSMPHLFIMGIVFGWLRQKTGSLLPGMLAHFTHNFLVLLSEQHRSLLPW